ncbi:MAG: recombinase family protein [Oscillospiraceae bacterium]|nr:recombinase family protein [Oscillospiraceae bacterium]
MSEVDIYQKLTEIEEAPRFSMIFGDSSDRSDKISEHRLWLQSIRKEHPLPATPYRVGVYIRYFNQTKYENYLDYHIKNFEDTLALCPKWTLVDFYIDEGATAPNMESAPEWCRLLDDCFDGKVDLIITQKVSNVSKKSQEITFVSRLLASLDKPVGIYFISEDIFTLASYYKADIQDKEFLPEGFQVLPEPNVRGELHD